MRPGRIATERTRLAVLSLFALACRASEKDPSPPGTEAASTAGASGGASAMGSAPVAQPTPAVTAATPAECQGLERKVQHAVTTAYFVMNSGGAYLSAFDESWQALGKCPDSEPLWYTFARLAELGFERLPMEVAGAHVGTAADAAALARSRQPRSARIAVVDARTHGDIERARSALALDPSYAPARVALAAALFEHQHLDEALPLSDAPNVPGAASLRARILVTRAAPGDAKQAERLARRELTASWDAPEPYDMQPIRCAAQEALALALHAQHSRQAKSELDKAVQCGSARANELLRAMP